MSAISIETKKVTELEALATPSDAHAIPIHDGTGLKRVTFANLKASAVAATEEKIAPLLFNNAGAHNSAYRGKSLGTSVTAAQYSAISSGTFTDLYIGDYWTISDINWRIAGFDYFLNCGDTKMTAHHAVIVPDTCLYNAAMNSTNFTTGGYAGSAMRSTNIAQAKTTIKSAFSGHVLLHREYLVNAVASGRPSGIAWFDSEVELMNEQMVYGGGIFGAMSDGTDVPSNHTIGTSQLPLFRLEPSRINNADNWWLRDVVDANTFADVYKYGYANYNNASFSLGVRPYFCIG